MSFYDLEIIKEYGGQSENFHCIEFKFKCRTRGQKGFRFSDEEIHNETSLFEKIHMDNGKGKWLFRDSIDQSKDG